ncbi:PREDICTED: uncharacterized protein LOC104611439 [Nelumbo nucifera]|uniref:C2H2-type domain-containing protein n=2 Tax=Nelumbo nucifera TaxID=4432 RepID=A0A822YMK2_NELNU|nr:PREDICTED: uncharacterized protein LOC104611439 [Nelumbo nucifera]DAD33717.1 TPA_asm: hypothetical protein HUJ06_012568 [Nelumbo nucifera]
MVGFLRFRVSLSAILSRRSPTQDLGQGLDLGKFSHFGLKLRFGSSDPSSTLVPKTVGNNVGIFWDLDNKPPNSFPPYEAAVKLRTAASAFGIIRYMVAYANRHAFSYVPPVVREQRKERKALDQLEKKGIIMPAEPYLCRVCGRKFYTNVKLVNHFKQLHEREQMKRMNRLESARGKQRVKLVAKFSMKMEKYKKAVRDVLTPKVGYGLADELKRAGFWVQTVSDKPQAADIALRNRMVEMMDKRRVECLVLVSDDSDFLDVLREARLRCLKTVVVGDNNNGDLKRCADVGFSWKEVLLGKAKKEASSVLGKWKDRDVLKRLEWTYKPGLERKEYDFDASEYESEDGDIEENLSMEVEDLVEKEDVRPWWELVSDTEDTAGKLFK